MSQQFPGFRLITLLARQASAPLATRIKVYAKTHPKFSNAICVRTANLYRYAEHQAKCMSLRAAGIGDKWWQEHPPAPLSPKEAIEKGGDILGEVIIFILGANILIFELNRQAEKAQAKEAKEKEAWARLKQVLQQTKLELDQQQERIDALKVILNETMEEQDGKKTKKPKLKDQKPMPDTNGGDGGVLLSPGLPSLVPGQHESSVPGVGTTVVVPGAPAPGTRASGDGPPLQKGQEKTTHKPLCRCCECCDGANKK